MREKTRGAVDFHMSRRSGRKEVYRNNCVRFGIYGYGTCLTCSRIGERVWKRLSDTDSRRI